MPLRLRFAIALPALLLPLAWTTGATDNRAQGATIRGYLVIVGGGSRPDRVMQRFADLAKLHGNGRIVVIPNASADPEETGKSQAAEIARFTDRKVEWLRATKENANSDETIRFMEGAGGVFFSGGVQSRLTELLNGTRLLESIRGIYRSGGVIGGTSAGAAVMSRIMITGDEKRYAGDEVLRHIERDNIVTAEGFGFLEDVIVDQHFVRRSRHNRLLSLVLENPGMIGIGIDEQTAVVCRPDRVLEVVGAGQVIVYDPTDAVVSPQKSTRPFLLGGYNLKLHILVEGQAYDLKKRKVVRR
jgi:cyanophycinase